MFSEDQMLFKSLFLWVVISKLTVSMWNDKIKFKKKKKNKVIDISPKQNK